MTAGVEASQQEKRGSNVVAIGMAIAPLAMSGAVIFGLHKMLTEPLQDGVKIATAALQRCNEASRAVYGNTAEGKIKISEIPQNTVADCALEDFISKNVSPTDTSNVSELLSPDTVITFPSQTYIDQQTESLERLADTEQKIFIGGSAFIGAIGLGSSVTWFRREMRGDYQHN
jgi:hypothetical protein